MISISLIDSVGSYSSKSYIFNLTITEKAIESSGEIAKTNETIDYQSITDDKELLAATL